MGDNVFKVTVEEDEEGNKKYLINGKRQKALLLHKGTQYTFDLSDDSCTGHPFLITDNLINNHIPTGESESIQYNGTGPQAHRTFARNFYIESFDNDLTGDETRTLYFKDGWGTSHVSTGFTGTPSGTAYDTTLYYNCSKHRYMGGFIWEVPVNNSGEVEVRTVTFAPQPTEKGKDKFIIDGVAGPMTIRANNTIVFDCTSSTLQNSNANENGHDPRGDRALFINSLPRYNADSDFEDHNYDPKNPEGRKWPSGQGTTLLSEVKYFYQGRPVDQQEWRESFQYRGSSSGNYWDWEDRRIEWRVPGPVNPTSTQWTTQRYYWDGKYGNGAAGGVGNVFNVAGPVPQPVADSTETVTRVIVDEVSMYALNGSAGAPKTVLYDKTFKFSGNYFNVNPFKLTNDDDMMLNIPPG